MFVNQSYHSIFTNTPNRTANVVYTGIVLCAVIYEILFVLTTL